MGNNSSKIETDGKRKQRLVAELSAIRKLQAEPPSFFQKHDHARLAGKWESKSRELVNLEIAAYQRKLHPGK